MPAPQSPPAATAAEAPQEAARFALWEVELLIAGTAVFATLQLPGLLGDWLDDLLPRLGADLAPAVVLLFSYLDIASVVLALSFVACLVLRARWIAAIALHRVYPDGPPWAQLGSGPLQREAERELAGDPAAHIRHADTVASLSFAVGIALTSMILALAASVIGLFALVVGVARLFTPAPDGGVLMFIAAAILVVPLLLATLVDRTAGARLAPEGTLRRAVKAVFAGYARIGLGQASFPLALIKRKRRGLRILAIAAGVLVATLILVAFNARLEHRPLGAYGLFPLQVAGGQFLDPAHYEDQRDALRDASRPYIQSLAVEGNYLVLRVPYLPARDLPAQRAQCPSAPAAAAAEARDAALLACLAGLHPVQLDGKPLAAPAWLPGLDPRNRRPVLSSVIDVGALAPGAHELAVGLPSKSAQAAPERIPFWR